MTLARFGGTASTLLLPEVRTRDVVVIASKILTNSRRRSSSTGMNCLSARAFPLLPGSRRFRGSADPERRHRDVPRQGARQKRLSVLLGRNEQQVLDAALPRAGTAQRARDRTAAGLLPTTGRFGGRPHHRRRSARALATSAPRSNRARRLLIGCRRNGPHHPVG